MKKKESIKKLKIFTIVCATGAFLSLIFNLIYLCYKINKLSTSIIGGLGFPTLRFLVHQTSVYWMFTILAALMTIIGGIFLKLAKNRNKML
jgi:hypothetical protein